VSTAELFSVAGRTALVTGGSRGVGLMVARGLVRAGAHVHIAARDAEALAEAVDELAAEAGGTCTAVRADLSSEQGCRELADTVAEEVPALDILVNNAGIHGPLSRRRHDEAAWRQVVAVNLEGVYHLTSFLLPSLRRAARAGAPSRVINIGSVTGLSPPHLDAYAYAASKAGVHHLTTHLAKRLAPRVTVNALALGPFESRMTENALTVVGGMIAEGTPLKRIGRPGDVAGTALFLASRAGAYVTGAVIPVDGGLSRAG
jgi:NAD(P)-dependent dehydrogenase (short-subunit alcohol dehydrogenase family)